MDAKTEEDQLLQSILDGSLLPEVLTSATSATPQSMTSLPSQDTLSDVSDASDTSTAAHAVDEASSDAEASLEAISGSSDTSGDEIPLSELENSLDAVSVEYRCLPLFLSSFTLRLSNAELQVTGCDSLRTVSYSVESLTFALASKAINSLERLVQGASLAFYCDDYPYARDALICVLHTLAHGRVSMDDVARFAWCASHPFLHGDKNTRAWSAGDGTA